MQLTQPVRLSHLRKWALGNTVPHWERLLYFYYSRFSQTHLVLTRALPPAMKAVSYCAFAFVVRVRFLHQTFYGLLGVGRERIVADNNVQIRFESKTYIKNR